MDKTTLRRPATLFISAAALLAMNGLIFFHSDWPPMKHAHWYSHDFGEELLGIAGIFAGTALVYFTVEKFCKIRVSPLLSYFHFCISLAAILVEMFLDYWLNMKFKTIPGERRWDHFLRAFSASMQGSAWAASILTVAQLVFLFNLSLGIYRRIRTRPLYSPDV